MSAPSIDTSKYRIRQAGVNEFYIQQRILGFWITVTEYPSWTVEHAREIVKAWEENAAVRGRVFPV